MKFFCPKCHKLAAELIRTEEKVELRQNGKVLISLGAQSHGNTISVKCASGHSVTVRGLESTDQITMSGSGKVNVSQRLPMENFRKGATAPTEATRAGVAGFLFDADAETLYVQFCVPTDWDAASDMTLILHCILNADEPVNDKIDWETSVISIADHEDVDTAGTQTPGANHDIGAIVGAGSFHKVNITLDYDNGTCPISAGDNVSISLSRTANVGTAGYVAGVIVIDICVMYQSNKLGEAV